MATTSRESWQTVRPAPSLVPPGRPASDLFFAFLRAIAFTRFLVEVILPVISLRSRLGSAESSARRPSFHRLTNPKKLGDSAIKLICRGDGGNRCARSAPVWEGGGSRISDPRSRSEDPRFAGFRRRLSFRELARPLLDRTAPIAQLRSIAKAIRENYAAGRIRVRSLGGELGVMEN
jgi:hypothetical protein